MLTPQQAKDFKHVTDYPSDKVLQDSGLSGSFTALARYGVFQPRRTDNPVLHDIGYYGLIVGSYSFNNEIWYPFGVTTADISGAQPTFQTVEVSAYCNDSQVTIRASNYLLSSVTIYYALEILSRD